MEGGIILGIIWFSYKIWAHVHNGEQLGFINENPALYLWLPGSASFKYTFFHSRILSWIPDVHGNTPILGFQKNKSHNNKPEVWLRANNENMLDASFLLLCHKAEVYQSQK